MKSYSSVIGFPASFRWQIEKGRESRDIRQQPSKEEQKVRTPDKCERACFIYITIQNILFNSQKLKIKAPLALRVLESSHPVQL